MQLQSFAKQRVDGRKHLATNSARTVEEESHRLVHQESYNAVRVLLSV